MQLLYLLFLMISFSNSIPNRSLSEAPSTEVRTLKSLLSTHQSAQIAQIKLKPPRIIFDIAQLLLVFGWRPRVWPSSGGLLLDQRETEGRLVACRAALFEPRWLVCSLSLLLCNISISTYHRWASQQQREPIGSAGRGSGCFVPL